MSPISLEGWSKCWPALARCVPVEFGSVELSRKVKRLPSLNIQLNHKPGVHVVPQLDSSYTRLASRARVARRSTWASKVAATSSADLCTRKVYSENLQLKCVARVLIGMTHWSCGAKLIAPCINGVQHSLRASLECPKLAGSVYCFACKKADWNLDLLARKQTEVLK